MTNSGPGTPVPPVASPASAATVATPAVPQRAEIIDGRVAGSGQQTANELVQPVTLAAAGRSSLDGPLRGTLALFLDEDSYHARRDLANQLGATRRRPGGGNHRKNRAQSAAPVRRAATEVRFGSRTCGA